MARYNTKNKQAVMDFLYRDHDKAWTIDEIIEGIENEYPKDEAPGHSTVYRIISQLVEEGLVVPQLKEDGKKRAYQPAEHECNGNHLHLKCTQCGQLIHMDDDVSAAILTEVLKNKGFSVDEEQTVIIGKCKNCSQKSK